MSEPAPLPTFLLVGTAKAGTTALIGQVARHPGVFTPRIKEPMYFALRGSTARFRGPGDGRVNGYAVTDPAAYGALFHGSGGARARGEASTWYLYSPEAPARIREEIPGCRIVGVLRDPAERAWSAFLHMRGDGREPEAEFAAALAREEERARDGWAWIWRYRGMGFYAAQVRRYRDCFPPEQLLWILYEDWVRDPRGVRESVFRHIGVDPGFDPGPAERVNASGIPRSRSLHRLLQEPSALRTAARALLPDGIRKGIVGMVRRANFPRPDPPAAAMAELRGSFAEDVRELSTLLGRDLSAWLPAGGAVGGGGGRGGP